MSARTLLWDADNAARLIGQGREVWLLDGTATDDGYTLHLGTEEQVREALLDQIGEPVPAEWKLRRVGVLSQEVSS